MHYCKSRFQSYLEPAFIFWNIIWNILIIKLVSHQACVALPRIAFWDKNVRNAGDNFAKKLTGTLSVWISVHMVSNKCRHKTLPSTYLHVAWLVGITTWNFPREK